jgi:hypothetical protein
VSGANQEKAHHLFRTTERGNRSIAAELGERPSTVAEWRRVWYADSRPQASRARAPARETPEQYIERAKQESTADQQAAADAADPWLQQAREMLDRSPREMRARRLASLLEALHQAEGETAKSKIQGWIDRLMADAQNDQEEDADPLHEMSDGELTAALEATARDLPEHLLEPVAAVLLERLDPAWVRLQLQTTDET